MLLARAKELRAAGRRPFVWDRITGRPIAAVSYALCLAELLDQLRARRDRADACLCSCRRESVRRPGDHKAILGWPGQVRLLCPIRWPWDTPKDLAEVANQTAALLGLPHRLSAADIDIRDDYMGPKYGAVTPGGREAMDLIARTEGILLDPVYTAKALAGLIDDTRQGRLGAKDQAVFIHTGGTPAIFAYRDELSGQR